MVGCTKPSTLTIRMMSDLVITIHENWRLFADWGIGLDRQSLLYLESDEYNHTPEEIIRRIDVAWPNSTEVSNRLGASDFAANLTSANFRLSALIGALRGRRPGGLGCKCNRSNPRRDSLCTGN
jgi:hypothetical protein